MSELNPARIVKRIMILNPELIQALIISSSTISTIPPKVLINPRAIILT